MDALLGKTPALRQALHDLPLQGTLERLVNYVPDGSYNQLKPALRELTATLVARFGEGTALRYGLMLLAARIREHDQWWDARRLDAEIEVEFIDSFHRILNAVARGGVSALMPDTDAYAKELAICLYRVIPAGGQLIDPAGGVPRRWFARWPTPTNLNLLRYVLFNARGFAPFAQFHTNLFQRRWFTPAGWEYAFRRMFAVFRSYPALKGLVGSSWFFDPALAAISPELDFVRAIPLRYGAVFVRVQRADSGGAGAFSLAPERRKLFETGQYDPQIYAFILSRRDILASVAAPPLR